MSFVPSTSTNKLKKKSDNATNKYNNYVNEGYSTGAGGFGKQIKSASTKLNQLYKNKPSDQFNYSNQNAYNKALNDVTNRKPFEYDISNDTLFQQAKEQYQAMGKTASEDTIGQASTMTGGYGNSYATTAGAQAYQGYLQEINNSIGDYYAMALSGYQNETDRLINNFNVLSTDRNQQLGEWQGNQSVYQSLYGLYSNDYQNALQNDMSVWGQQGENYYNIANLYDTQYNNSYANDFNKYSTEQSLALQRASQNNATKYVSGGNSPKGTPKKDNISDEEIEQLLSTEPKNTKYTAKLISDIEEKWYSTGNKYFKDFEKANIMGKDMANNEIKEIAKTYLKDVLSKATLKKSELSYLADYYSFTSEDIKDMGI